MAVIISYYSFLSFFCLLCFVENVLTMKGREITEEDAAPLHHDTHIVQLDTLLPKTICMSSSKGPNKDSTLRVVHRRGPCFELNQFKQNVFRHIQILQADESRMKSIDNKLFTNLSSISNFNDPTDLQEWIKYGINYGMANYIVTAGFGTPKQDVFLIFDTSVVLTWMRCRTRNIFTLPNQAFFYTKSETYVRCNVASSLHLNSTSGNFNDIDKDSSLSFGKDRLTLTPHDIFENFLFGCSNRNNERGYISGILGLGKEKVSIISQTAHKYKQIFSYCLPSVPSFTGYLRFGYKGSSSVKYTPLVMRGSTFYGLDIIGISVGGHKLSITETVFLDAGTIIDPGIDVTRLPFVAYDVLRTEFVKRMSYPMTKGHSILDTCYDLSHYESVAIPTVSFYFKGGIQVDLHHSGIFYIIDTSCVCLAFTKTRHESNVAILGNMIQKTLEMVYDIGEKRIGFGHEGCK